jgi:hypothetical protein
VQFLRILETGSHLFIFCLSPNSVCICYFLKLHGPRVVMTRQQKLLVNITRTCAAKAPCLFNHMPTQSSKHNYMENIFSNPSDEARASTCPHKILLLLPTCRLVRATKSLIGDCLSAVLSPAHAPRSCHAPLPALLLSWAHLSSLFSSTLDPSPRFHLHLC